MERTVEAGVWIEERGEHAGKGPYIVYRSLNGERWVIYGTCIACGECEVGSLNENLRWTGVPVGQEGACVDTTYGERPDIPVRPEISERCEHCTLSGEYLNGH